MATPPRAPYYSTENKNTLAVIPESDETEASVAEETEVFETTLKGLCKDYEDLQQYDTKISESDDKTEEKLHEKPPDEQEKRKPNSNKSENVMASTSRESTTLPLNQSNRLKESFAKKSGAGTESKLLTESNIIQSHQNEDDISATAQKIEKTYVSHQQHILQETYNPGVEVVENLEAFSKSKILTDPNLDQHQQSVKTSTCEETKTHVQQEDLRQDYFPEASVSEQSDPISKSKTLIDPNLNQSHQDENIKSNTIGGPKISAPLHRQEVQKDFTRDEQTANIQESSECDEARKILSDSSSSENRQGKTIEQLAGVSGTCTPLQQKQVRRESVADQIKASVSKKFGTVPKSTGAVAKNTGAVPKNTGTVPKNTGTVPKNTGYVPKNTGAVPKSTGAVPKNSRKAYSIPSKQRYEFKKYTSNSKSAEDRKKPSTSATFRTANIDMASNYSTPLGKFCSTHKKSKKFPEKSIKTLAGIPEIITHDHDYTREQQSSSSFTTCSENFEVAQDLIIVPGSHSRASEHVMFPASERTSSVEHSAGASCSSFKTHALTQKDRNQAENKQKLTRVGISPHHSNPPGIDSISDTSDEELSQAEQYIASMMDVVEHSVIPSGLVDRLLESGFEVELSQPVEESESSVAPEERRMRIKVTQVSKDSVFSDFNQLRISERYDDDTDS